MATGRATRPIGWGREGLQEGLQEAWQEIPAEIREGIHSDDALLAGCDTASGAVGAVSGVHVGSEAVGWSGRGGHRVLSKNLRLCLAWSCPFGAIPLVTLRVAWLRSTSGSTQLDWHP